MLFTNTFVLEVTIPHNATPWYALVRSNYDLDTILYAHCASTGLNSVPILGSANTTNPSNTQVLMEVMLENNLITKVTYDEFIDYGTFDQSGDTFIELVFEVAKLSLPLLEWEACAI